MFIIPPEQFPFRIVHTWKCFGLVSYETQQGAPVSKRCLELVIDDQQQVWLAEGGRLKPTGGSYNHPNYLDPRTNCLLTTQVIDGEEWHAWVDLSAEPAEAIEKWSNLDRNVIQQIPPDRRSEWAEIFALAGFQDAAL